MSAKIVHQEAYERDGIAYEIKVESEEGGLWGNWDCTQCDEGGGSSKRCSLINEAVLAAKTNLRLHHAARHAKSR